MTVQLVRTEVNEPKEVKDIRIAVKDLLDSIFQARKDGFDMSDVPKIVADNYKNLVNAIDGFDQIDDAFKEELSASIVSIGLMGADITEVLTRNLVKRPSAKLTGETPEKKVAKKKASKKKASSKK